MVRFTRTVAGVLALVAITACGDELVTAPTTESATALTAIEPTSRHVLVLVEEDIPSESLLEDVGRRGGIVERQYDDVGVLMVSGLDDEDAEALAGRRDVDGIDRDFSVQWVPSIDEVVHEVIEAPAALSDQSGAFYFARGMQWNMTQIQAPEAWLVSGQGAGIVVAVLDSGIDPFHIDLAGKVAPGSVSMLTPGSSPCGAPDDRDVFDRFYHGTFVAGLIASNGLAMASVAPDATILAVKVLNCAGSGSFGDVIAGIMYASHEGADVINLSLGAYFSTRERGAKSLVRALQRAVDRAVRGGSSVVASAGNDGLDMDHDGDYINVPSQLRSVASVGATAPVAQMDFDALASYTNYGRSGVDIMAPGGDLTADGICGFAPLYRCDLVLSAFTGFIAGAPNFYVLSAGTSFAAPHVAGAMAIVKSTNRTRSPKCVATSAEDLGAPGTDPFYGRGRLNVLEAAECALARGRPR